LDRCWGISIPSVVLHVTFCAARIWRCRLVMLLWMEIWGKFLIQADMTTHSTQQANSISLYRRFLYFCAYLSGRSLRPGHSAAVGQFLASILKPSRSQPVKCPVERPRYQSSGRMRHENQGYFLLSSKRKLLHNSMPINAANPLQTDTKIENYIEWLSFTVNLPRSCLFRDLAKWKLGSWQWTGQIGSSSMIASFKDRWNVLKWGRFLEWYDGRSGNASKNRTTVLITNGLSRPRFQAQSWASNDQICKGVICSHPMCCRKLHYFCWL
jgi:hypothetical protein